MGAPTCPSHPASRRYDHVLLDLDGCVWVGDEPHAAARSRPSRALRAAGKGSPS